MNNAELVSRIDKARDGDNFHMVTASALHNQLATLTPADWRQASTIFTKKSASDTGFYIQDDANGKVTIHNDVNAANQIADSYVMKSTRADMQNALNDGLGSVIPTTLSLIANTTLVLPATLLGGMAATVDYQQNYLRQSADRVEIRNSSVLSF
jgi:hypothetical protein